MAQKVKKKWQIYNLGNKKLTRVRHSRNYFNLCLQQTEYHWFEYVVDLITQLAFD
jgi:hypothetical protein